jgi:membrane-associated phospholipid phosphatase
MRVIEHSAFLAWPGWAHFRYAAGRMCLVSIWFALIYGGSDWLTAQRTWRVPIHTAFELRIPLMPSFMVFYVSLYGLFLAVPFVLRTKAEIDLLARHQMTVIAIAGVCFLVLPADLAYPAATDLGRWERLFRWADDLNLDHNLVPSLHVAMSAVSIKHYSSNASTAVRWSLLIWGWLIAVSTILTHQHHLLDAVAGYALAIWVCWRFRRNAAES